MSVRGQRVVLGVLLLGAAMRVAGTVDDYLKTIGR
jgi:hypothetical protein